MRAAAPLPPPSPPVPSGGLSCAPARTLARQPLRAWRATVGFQPTFSRHGIAQSFSALALLIWLNEKVQAWRETVTRCLEIICHASTADVPRRYGRRATPAWQTCRAGAANKFKAFRHRSVPFRNGFSPLENGLISLFLKQLPSLFHFLLDLSTFFTPKNGGAFSEATVAGVLALRSYSIKRNGPAFVGLGPFRFMGRK